VCVDTWLGAEEFCYKHDDPTRYESLRLKNGYPQVYYTFLANVVRARLDDYITPFAMPSTLAAKLFRWWEQRADLVYLDASHDEAEVIRDLQAWGERTDKVLFGHDIRQFGVVRAVDKYRQNCDRPHHYRVRADWWIMDF
jgi:hypothetical protein